MHSSRIVLNNLFLYRLILTCALVVSKFYNDVFYGNNFIAQIGGVQLSEMNLLEVEFLKLINWSIWMDSNEFNHYLNGVLSHFSAIEQSQEPS